MRTPIWGIAIIVGICSAALFSDNDSVMQERVSPAIFQNQVPVSQQRIDEVKEILIAKFDGIDKTKIQVRGAPKGITAVGGVISETKSDLAIVKDPCDASSAMRPVIFATP